jgi:hypothetical protein
MTTAKIRKFKKNMAVRRWLAALAKLLMTAVAFCQVAVSSEFLPPEIETSLSLEEVKEGETSIAEITLRNPNAYPQTLVLRATRPASQWTISATCDGKDISEELFDEDGWDAAYLANGERVIQMTISPTIADPALTKGEVLNLEITAATKRLAMGTIVRSNSSEIELVEYDWTTTGGGKKVEFAPIASPLGTVGQIDTFVVNVDEGNKKVTVHTKTDSATGKDYLLEVGDSVLNDLGMRCTLDSVSGDVYVVSIKGESNDSPMRTVNIDFGEGDVYEDTAEASSSTDICVTMAGKFQPDLMVAASDEMTYTAQGPYDETTEEPDRVQAVASLAMAEYFIRLQNAGDFDDAFALKMTALHSSDLDNKWIVRVFDVTNTSQEITDKLLSEDGWRAPAETEDPELLGPSSYRDLRLVVVPGAEEDSVLITLKASSEILLQEAEFLKVDQIKLEAKKAGPGHLRITQWKQQQIIR